MKVFRIALLATFVVCSASAAWAQYGLYGSPETLTLPQQPSNALPSYPNTGVPAVASPAYPTYYYPQQPQYAAPAQRPAAAASYPYQPYQAAYPQGSYRYPAQMPAAAMYQPYQAGAQYRYPVPASNAYGRPAMRTASLAQPPQPPAMPVPVEPANLAPAASPEYVGPNGAVVPQGPGLVDQMVREQGAWNNGGSCGAYGGACSPYGDGACDAFCGQGGCCPWYASFSALVLGRSDARRVWTSYATDDETEQLTNTDFPMEWKWGGEVRFGRRFCCNCVPYAVEGVYWTTEPFTAHRYTTNPGNYVSTPLVVTPMTFDGVAAQNWFDGAQEHRLWRRNEFHNFEINLVREQLAWACDSPWDIGWSIGVRYFRFREDLTFGSLRAGAQWGDLADEAYFSDTITNNLLGVQFGFDAAYCLFDGVRAFISPKVGLYNNYIESNFAAHTGDGINGEGPYGSFPVHASKNGIGFLTQIDAGVDWQFARNWSARVGYRVVALTGMGLADDQFPQYMVDIPDIANIQHTSSLVLHGAFFGLTYNF